MVWSDLPIGAGLQLEAVTGQPLQGQVWGAAPETLAEAKIHNVTEIYFNNFIQFTYQFTHLNMLLENQKLLLLLLLI